MLNLSSLDENFLLEKRNVSIQNCGSIICYVSYLKTQFFKSIFFNYILKYDCIYTGNTVKLIANLFQNSLFLQMDHNLEIAVHYQYP